MADDPQLNMDLQNIQNNLISRMNALEERVNDAASSQYDEPPEGVVIVDELIAPGEGVTVTDPNDTSFYGAGVTGGGRTFGSLVMNMWAVAAGVLQVGFNTLGQLLAGAGAVVLDALGITITAGASFTNPTAYKFSDGTNIFAYINAVTQVTSQAIETTITSTAKQVTNFLTAAAPSGKFAQIVLQVFSGLQSAAMTAYVNDASSESYIHLNKFALNEYRGDNIASASTASIGNSNGNYVHITGTATITSFGDATQGTRRIVYFEGALTLTHNGTSLILPGGANITTAAGDVAEMVAWSTNNWKCVTYQRNSSQPVAGTNTGDNAFADTFSPQGWDASLIWSLATVAVSTTKLRLTVSASTNLIYYWRGTKVNLGATSLQVTSTADKAEGIWYCYSTDGTNFVLSQTPFYIHDMVSGAIRADLMLWEFYWDNTNNVALWIQPEMHPSSWGNTSMHTYAHESFGTRYSSGMDITYGTTAANNDTRVKLTAGELHDEGIAAQITHDAAPNALWEQILGSAGTADANFAALPIYYLSGATPVWRKETANSYPFRPVSNTLMYYNRNNAGTWDYTTSITTANYWVAWIVGTTNQAEPVVVIAGRQNNASLTAAQAEAFPSLSGLFTEFKLLYRIIYLASNGNTNNGKCQIVSVTDYRRDAIANNAGSTATPSAATVSFTPSGNIAATNVQAAIEELDSEKVPTTRTITTTAPITIDGGASADLSANRTIAISAATGAAAGSMSATDKAKLDLVVSNVYTPSLTNVTNVASSSAISSQYIRVGNIVVVGGTVTIDPTATGALELGMSLPIASDFTGNGNCGGTFANEVTTGSVGRINADTTNDRARFSMNVVDIASRTYSFTFTYLIA